MNEFQAAMGLCNLRHIEDCIIKRKKLSERYHEQLDGIYGIRLCSEQDGVKSNYAYMPVVFDGFHHTRDEVFEKLMKHDIVARKYFYPITCDLECYQMSPFAKSASTPVARHISAHVLTLPIYEELEFETVDKICSIIKKDVIT